MPDSDSTVPEGRRRTPRPIENDDFLQGPAARPLRILGEYIYPDRVLREEGVTDTVVFFGSARVAPPPELRQDQDLSGRDYSDAPPERINRYYMDARELARRITSWSMERAEAQGRRILVVTGGGPGIMEAANRGAGEAGGHSVGLNIELPHEQNANPYITPALSISFQYFFMRKYWFLYYARALIVFPGGFGTLDELFETLTLQQTRTIRNQIPVILFGRDFWRRLIDFEFLAESGLISAQDLCLFQIVDTVDEAMTLMNRILAELIEQ
ncbi:MAG: TIGR00730 family Rossman fold protein [Leptospirales bacterium]|nr:TIGR00730 family Rossman fold protein [Leptospirales bacterium]